MGGEVTLGSLLARVETGWSPACDAYPPAGDEWGVIKVSAVTSGNFQPGEAKRLPSGLQPRWQLEIRTGDVLIARANGARSLVGAVCQVGPTRRRLMLSDKILRLVPDGEVAEATFLAILLRSAGVRRQIGNLLNGGTGQNNISQTDIRALAVPDVPLDEQRRIVAAHAAFERRIGMLEAVRAKTVRLVDVLVEQLLHISGEVSLGSLLTRIEAGKSPSAEDMPAAEGEWGVLKVSAVQAGWFASRENKVIRDPALIHPRYEVKHGDLLMTRANTEELVGLACVSENPPPRLLLSDKTLRLHVNESVADPRFLELALARATVRQSVRAQATGTSAGMKNIGQEQIRQLSVPDVPLDEQRRIVAVRAAFDQRIERQAAVVAKLRAVQQAVVEDLLTGHAKAYAA
ncbi:hypothetical protein [Streptomyces sp. NPDC048641]|uniref:restriction endonuclease subunit S n=1 Tax=unclassified Streptomyces TaxID=2593676 RepID=UPI003441B55A